jgi:hypothetical protein
MLGVGGLARRTAQSALGRASSKQGQHQQQPLRRLVKAAHPAGWQAWVGFWVWEAGLQQTLGFQPRGWHLMSLRQQQGQQEQQQQLQK